MSTLRVDTIQNAAGTDSPISVPGTAKAWVNFNGTGTVAIRASYNVSSITDIGTGDYRVNFTTAMPDTNYCAVISTTRMATFVDGGDSVNVFSTTSVTINHVENLAGYDTVTFCAAIFR